ncbi:hypothetical protein DRN67_04145 [Candidatus Micrarchaeota archaeon]|nr:MAG: hypothetical protein DRN67_04145 [Candidatus Micrarchaeota archaeon]
MAPSKSKDRGVLPVRVSAVDELFDKKGVERGSTLLVSGGVGTGKSTFCMQSAYNSAVAGEKVIYISFEEPIEKMQRHMEENFGWKVSKMVEQKRMMFLQIDPLELSESVKKEFEKKDKEDMQFDIKLPFRPDRLVLDSITVLSAAFAGGTNIYRMYLSYLLRTLERANSVNLVISETGEERIDKGAARVEAFICDGELRLHEIRKKDVKQNALEIRKARWTGHSKKLVPYRITDKGFEIFRRAEVFV